MSRPKRFGRDSNLVSDGTINDVYIYQYVMHWSMACTSYLPMLQAGACIHIHEKIHPWKNMCSFYLSIYMFCNFFPIILPWDWNIWIKNNTNYSTIYLESPCKIVGWCFPHHTITWQSWEVHVRTITACRGINELYVWLYEENSSVQTVDITIYNRAASCLGKMPQSMWTNMNYANVWWSI